MSTATTGLRAEQLGISTLTWRELEPAAAIRRAHELGYAAVDIGFISRMGPVGSEHLVADFGAVLAPIEAAMAETGLRVAAFNARIYSEDPAERRAQAEALGRAAMRLGAAGGICLGHGRVDDQLAAVVADLAPVCEAVAATGAVPTVESHRNNFTERIAQAEALLAAIPALRLTLDASHWISRGHRPADWEHLLPSVVHAHIRSCSRETLTVPPDACCDEVEASLRQLAEAGYQGCCTTEMIGDEAGSLGFRERLRADGCFVT